MTGGAVFLQGGGEFRCWIDAGRVCVWGTTIYGTMHYVIGGWVLRYRMVLGMRGGRVVCEGFAMCHHLRYRVVMGMVLWIVVLYITADCISS